MPRGDRTGPMGMGPMTGRGAGICGGFGVPGFMNAMPGRGGMGMGLGRGRGRGFGMGMGWGRGWGRGWAFQGAQVAPQPVSSQQVDELSLLKNQAKYFDEALQSINSRISELDTETK
ncbi:MAG: DUF5320 domain-containing protein [Chitinispirillaceae bacterium]|nr:DUF5320 domain-containing protein [Chitinispirillaceae bacterium]